MSYTIIIIFKQLCERHKVYVISYTDILKNTCVLNNTKKTTFFYLHITKPVDIEAT